MQGQPLLRAAQATRQPVESLLLTNLQANLPSLQGLSPKVQQNLELSELLSDESLRRVTLKTFLLDEQQRLSELLDANQAGTITNIECDELSTLQHQADLVMRRKAHAAVKGVVGRAVQCDLVAARCAV